MRTASSSTTKVRVPRLVFRFFCALIGHSPACWDQTPRGVLARLVALAAEAGVPRAEMELLLSPALLPELHVGLKTHTKYARQNGIHASPSVMINGIVDGSVSSSMSATELRALLATKL